MRATFRALGERGGRERGRRVAHRRRARLPPRAGAPARLRGGDLLRARGLGPGVDRRRRARDRRRRHARLPGRRPRCTPSSPATTGSPCSPTARTTRRRWCACRARAWSAAAGSGSRPRTTTRSSARPPPARSSCPTPTPRPPCSVALEDVELEADKSASSTPPSATSPAPPARCARGLRHVVVAPRALNCPPHWHAAEHELFVVLDGDGTLLLYDNQGELAEEHALRPGHCVSCPAGHAPRPRAARRRAGPDLPGLRHPRHRRDRLLPALEEGVAGPRARAPRAGRRLLGGRV